MFSPALLPGFRVGLHGVDAALVSTGVVAVPARRGGAQYALAFSNEYGPADVDVTTDRRVTTTFRVERGESIADGHVVDGAVRAFLFVPDGLGAPAAGAAVPDDDKGRVDVSVRLAPPLVCREDALALAREEEEDLFAPSTAYRGGEEEDPAPAAFALGTTEAGERLGAPGRTRALRDPLPPARVSFRIVAS